MLMVTLAEELPFAACVQDDQLDEVCSSCFKCKETQTNLHLSRCIGCRVLHYCSNECQKKDWVNHKHECPLLKNLHSRVPNVMIRLIARIVFKLKRSDAQDASFNGRRFEDLTDHSEDMMEDPGKMYGFGVASADVNRFMGKEHAPKPSDLMSILGKIDINGFAIYDFMGASTNCFEALLNFKKPIGKAIYVGLSVHVHRCSPDAFLVSEGPKLILRTPDLDKEYSKDASFKNLGMAQSAFTAQEEKLQKQEMLMQNGSTNRNMKMNIWMLPILFFCIIKPCSAMPSEETKEEFENRHFWNKMVMVFCIVTIGKMLNETVFRGMYRDFVRVCFSVLGLFYLVASFCIYSKLQLVAEYLAIIGVSILLVSSFFSTQEVRLFARIALAFGIMGLIFKTESIVFYSTILAFSFGAITDALN